MIYHHWVQETETPAIPVHIICSTEEVEVLKAKNALWDSWLTQTGFSVGSGQVALLPDAQGQLAAVLYAVDSDNGMRSLKGLPALLPAGQYQLQQSGLVATDDDYQLAILLLAEAAYKFELDDENKKQPQCVWVVSSNLDWNAAAAAVSASQRVRDLINMPANYLQPPDLFLATKELCGEHDAQLTTLQGCDLLGAGYEATYRVGQVGTQEPCLLDFTWGAADAPTVTLVGKGVCFDSGGLCLKTAKGMLTMKKDMGGAAHVLGLAEMIMSNKLPVRLRVLIPAVENGIGAGAYRPGDVLRYKDGTTVEVTNTDAEGRLVLADALLAACEDGAPDCLIDFATLTGAARIAVGMELAAFFTTKGDSVSQLLGAGDAVADPVWPMPLYKPYLRAMSSQVADLANASSTGYGGAITAALFLQHFVPDGANWWHFDISAWVEGRNPGAATMGIRAVYQWLTEHFLQ